MRYLTFTDEQIAACPQEIEKLNRLNKFLIEKFGDKYDLWIKKSNTCRLTEIELYKEWDEAADKFYFDAEFEGDKLTISIDSSDVNYFKLRNKMEYALREFRNYGFIIKEPEL